MTEALPPWLEVIIPLEPARQPLRAYAGATFAPIIQLWADDERAEPFDLTGYVVTMDIVGVKTLTEGDGLTVTPDDGEIQPVLTSAATAAAANRSTRVTRYTLAVAKESVETYVMRGAFTFEQL